MPTFRCKANQRPHAQRQSHLHGEQTWTMSKLQPMPDWPDFGAVPHPGRRAFVLICDLLQPDCSFQWHCVLEGLPGILR